MSALTSPEGAKVFADYGLDENPQRLVFILANMCAETGGLSLIWESMNYRADRIVTIFGRAANINEAEARRLAGNEEALAERVYGLGNMRKARDLGNTEPGDGFRYRGGGFLQTTGRDNYRRMGRLIGEDLEGNSKLIENPLISLKAACAEWQKGKLNDYADDGSFRACCNGINYGKPTRDGDPIGYDDRLEYLQKGLQAFGLPKPRRRSGALESVEVSADHGVLELGDRNHSVESLQRQLIVLGYDAGEPTGVFNTRTRDALLIFQVHNGLPLSGVTDWATRQALTSSDAIANDHAQSDAMTAPPARPAEPDEPVLRARPAVAQPTAPAQPVPRPAGVVAWTILVLSLLGLTGTIVALAALVDRMPGGAPLRSMAADVSPSLMIVGWLFACAAAIAHLRSRRS